MALSWIIERVSTARNTQMHKDLDCQNEHKREKNFLGLHGSSDRLLLPDHHSQLMNDDFE